MNRDLRRAVMRADKPTFGMPRDVATTLGVRRPPGAFGVVRPVIPSDMWVELAGTGAIVAGAESGELSINWNQDLIVTDIHLCASDVSATTIVNALTSLAFQLQISPPGESVARDGSAAAYVRFASVMGFDGSPKPFYRRVKQSDRWTFKFKNFAAATTFTPIVGLACRVNEVDCDGE